jgi:hypothetical protein
MKKNAIIAGVGVVALVIAYLAGYWPQHSQVNETRAQMQDLQTRLTAAEGRVRLGEVLGHLLRLSDAVAARNYGDASTLSSVFFDSVRTEATRADRPDVRTMLETIHATRDRVTSAIATADSTLGATLKEHEKTLRRSLGYPVNGAT